MTIPTITNEEWLASCAACKTANTMISNEDRKKEEVVESANFQDSMRVGRMREELEDLTLRIEYLQNIIDSESFKKIVPDETERIRITNQQYHMQRYSDTLKHRIDSALEKSAFAELVIKEGYALSHGSGSEYQFSAQTLYEFAEKIALAAIHDKKIQNSLMNQ